MTGARTVRGRSAVRALVVLLAGVLALWVSIGVTLNFTIAEKFPKLTEACWPANVNGKVAEANAVLTSQTSVQRDLAKFRASLRTAALREPVNSYALGSLAAMSDGTQEQSKVRALFKLSDAMSRRNVLTQMWLIEDSVAAGDVPAALDHYDRLMRVSMMSRRSLLPVLISAIDEPDILKAFLPVFEKRPLWWADFIYELSRNGTNSQVISTVTVAMNPDISDQNARIRTERLLQRILALHDDLAALRTINRVEGLNGMFRPLQNGDFERSDGVRPFAWWLRVEEDINAYREPVPNGSEGLWIETHDDSTGEAARQLVALVPGRHVLRGVVGNTKAQSVSSPEVEVKCQNGSSLSKFVPKGTVESGARFQFDFTVPESDCNTQWVVLRSAPEGDTRAWFDNLSISK